MKPAVHSRRPLVIISLLLPGIYPLLNVVFAGLNLHLSDSNHPAIRFLEPPGQFFDASMWTIPRSARVGVAHSDVLKDE
jgi:hypothetical protein